MAAVPVIVADDDDDDDDDDGLGHSVANTGAATNAHTKGTHLANRNGWGRHPSGIVA